MTSRPTAQQEFDFDHELPAGLRFFSLKRLAWVWSCTPPHVQALVDSGALRTVVDLRSEGSTKAMLRVPREAVTAFLDARLPAAAPQSGERLDFANVIPDHRDFYRAYEVARLLCCTTPHVVNLIEEGSFSPAVNLQAGTRSMWSVPRNALVTFLNAKRLA
jgi:hypothetical protein